VIQKWDARRRDYSPAVETEALDQRILLPLIEEAVGELLPAGALDRARAEESRLRGEAVERLRGLTG